MPDRDVNACGNAHPEDKVKAGADILLCFPCLETVGAAQGKVMTCFQVWSSWGVSGLIEAQLSHQTCDSV